LEITRDRFTKTHIHAQGIRSTLLYLIIPSCQWWVTGTIRNRSCSMEISSKRKTTKWLVIARAK